MGCNENRTVDGHLIVLLATRGTHMSYIWAEAGRYGDFALYHNVQLAAEVTLPAASMDISSHRHQQAQCMQSTRCVPVCIQYTKVPSLHKTRMIRLIFTGRWRHPP